MQALVAGCCENAELTKKGHCRGSYATPVIDKRLSPENTCRGCGFISGEQERSLFATYATHERQGRDGGSGGLCD